MITSSPHPRSLCEAFQSTAARHPDAVAIRAYGKGGILTWREYADRVRSIAAGLAHLGVGRGVTVALMLTNRPEFHLCDTAVLHTGATPFSMYNTNPAEMIVYLLDNADCTVVICERQFLPRVHDAISSGAAVEHVICVDGDEEGSTSLMQIESEPAPDFDFDASWQAVQHDDVLTIVYTSGTTGPPKGVELTHSNFIENAKITEEMGPLGFDDRAVSYLPDAHAANRWFTHYQNLLYGVTITTVADMAQLPHALADVRPTLFLGVPRVWIKAKAKLESVVAEQSPVKRRLAHWAFGVGRERARAASDGRAPGWLRIIKYAVADRLVLSAIRRRLGFDQLRIGVTGAAPIPPQVHEFILGLGLAVCEGYGMSECTAGATVNRPHKIKIGTVGTPVPGCEVTLADDGEVLVRGTNVMRGYRKDNSKTAETIDPEGWLHTGDIGAFDDDGYLRIVDRKKELIINAAGKNMSPTNIENTIAATTPLAGPVAVIGEARPYNTALVTLDPDAAAQRYPGCHIAELAIDPDVHTAIAAGIRAANEQLSRVEQIKRFTILGDLWEPGSEHLTPTGKLKRKPIAHTYSDVVETMY